MSHLHNKVAQFPIKIEGLIYRAKSEENDECYHISKNKKRIIGTTFLWGVKVGYLGLKMSFFQLYSRFSCHRMVIEELSWGQKKARTSRYSMMSIFPRYLLPSSPYDSLNHKNRKMDVLVFKHNECPKEL